MAIYKIFRNNNSKSKKTHVVCQVNGEGVPITKRVRYMANEKEAQRTVNEIIKDDLKTGVISRVLPGIDALPKEEK